MICIEISLDSTHPKNRSIDHTLGRGELDYQLAVHGPGTGPQRAQRLGLQGIVAPGSRAAGCASSLARRCVRGSSQRLRRSELFLGRSRSPSAAAGRPARCRVNRHCWLDRCVPSFGASCSLHVRARPCLVCQTILSTRSDGRLPITRRPPSALRCTAAEALPVARHPHAANQI